MFKTNVNRLVKQSVSGEVSYPKIGKAYMTTFEGKPSIISGMYGIKLNFRVGDPAYGWQADHIEPGVCIVNKGSIRQFTALNALACIGNEAKVISGDAKGNRGTVTGKHGYNRTFIDFQNDVLEELTLGDKIQIIGFGTGLSINGYEDIRVMSLSPYLIETIGIRETKSGIQVPVTKIIEGWMMGSGIGGGSGGIPELGDFDIQSTCPELTSKYDLNSLRIGDIVAIKDMLSHYARGISLGAVTIGVVSHGASIKTGHGPGVSPILSGRPMRIKPILNRKANVAYYLGLRTEKKW